MIPEPKPDQLYKLIWHYEEGDKITDGDVVGTHKIIRDDKTDEIIFIDFKVDGVLSVLRFNIDHVVSIQEYNYEKRTFHKL